MNAENAQQVAIPANAPNAQKMAANALVARKTNVHLPRFNENEKLLAAQV